MTTRWMTPQKHAGQQIEQGAHHEQLRRVRLGRVMAVEEKPVSAVVS